MFPIRFVALVLGAITAFAESPPDVRHEPLKDLDGYFPFTPSPTPEAWAVRHERVERQLEVTLGLYPRPKFAPLQPVIHGRMDLGDYTVEKVYFESLPGLFVTGNLYRPKDAPAKHPGVLAPYGHFENGRFVHNGDAEVKKLHETGAEASEEGARSPLQARCVGLARMGCTVFQYDMLDRGDSTQLPAGLPHKFAKQRPEMISPERWGLFSPQAEAHYQSVMGLQTLDSLRALDFLASLPEVDPARLACTGESGGGTQTMILAALERDRLAAAFPAVMVSTAMQGGCTCENACGLRVGTGNVEFAALFAPKPMGMSAADDWTKEMATKGFPELQQHWAMLGAADKVALYPHLQFPHNFNAVSRADMYGFFNRHLDLNLPPERLKERPFRLLTTEEMSVWDAEHPAPRGGPEWEKDLLQTWQNAVTPEELAKAAPKALEIVAGRAWSEAGVAGVEQTSVHSEEVENYRKISGVVRNRPWNEEVPVLAFAPKQAPGKGVLWLADEGTAVLLTPSGAPRPEVISLVEAGFAVGSADLFRQTEKVVRTGTVKNPREAAAYTYGYNDSLLAQRVHDLISLLRVGSNQKEYPRPLGVFAQGSTGPAAALARALAPALFTAAALDQTDFRFVNLTDWRDPMFLPGAAKYGDLPGILSAGGTRPLLKSGDPAVAIPWLIKTLSE